EWVTNWLRGIRQSIDQIAHRLGKGHLQFSAYVLGNRECNEFHGFDVPRLAKEGIFDFVCTRGDTFWPGEPYKPTSFLQLETDYFKTAVAGTACKLYLDLMPRQMPPNEYIEKARQLYLSGADGLSLWDAYDRIPWVDMWQTVRRLGHKHDLHVVS